MIILRTILIMTLSMCVMACFDHSSQSGTNSGNEQLNNSAGDNTILTPAGDIKESVMGELATGRWELVMFWATYCPVCKRDFEKLEKFIEDNPEIPLTVVGVVVDGIDQKSKALSQINNRRLDYTHILTDYNYSNSLYHAVTNSSLIGVPSQLLYDTQNTLVGFSHNALDIEALEIIVYE